VSLPPLLLFIAHLHMFEPVVFIIILLKHYR